MEQDNKIFSLDEKIQILARDIYDAALLKDSLKLEHFAPSKQVQNLLTEEEFISIIGYLRKNGILTFTLREAPIGVRNRNLSKSSFPTYKLSVHQPNIRRLLGFNEPDDKPAEIGIRLHPDYSYLLVNGVEIPLGKGEFHKSLQYWISKLCLDNPGKRVEETDIMAKYETDFDINGRSRAVRDAVYRLNPKLKAVTGIDKLFTYSNGYVVYNVDKLK